MTEFKETWGPVEHKTRHFVTLEPSPSVWVPTNKYHPDREYLVEMVTVTHEGKDGDFSPRTIVRLLVNWKMKNGRIAYRNGSLFIEELREVPAWLEDIIERAKPEWATTLPSASIDPTLRRKL